MAKTPSMRSAKTMQAKARCHAKIIRRNARIIVKLDTLMKKSECRTEGIATQKADLGREKRDLLVLLTRAREKLLDTQAKMREASAVVHSKISDHLLGDASGEDLPFKEASRYLAEAGGGIVEKIDQIQTLSKRLGEVGEQLTKLEKMQDDDRVQSDKMPAIEDKVAEIQNEMTEYLERMEKKMSAAIKGMVNEAECESDGDDYSEDEYCSINPEATLGAACTSFAAGI